MAIPRKHPTSQLEFGLWSIQSGIIRSYGGGFHSGPGFKLSFLSHKFGGAFRCVHLGCVYPKQYCVAISVFRKRTCSTIKTHVIDNPQATINIPAPWIGSSRHRTCQPDL